MPVPDTFVDSERCAAQSLGLRSTGSIRRSQDCPTRSRGIWNCKYLGTFCDLLTSCGGDHGERVMWKNMLGECPNALGVDLLARTCTKKKGGGANQ